MSNEEPNLRHSDQKITEQPYPYLSQQNIGQSDPIDIGKKTSDLESNYKTPNNIHKIIRICFICYSIIYILQFYSVYNPELNESLSSKYLSGIWILIFLDCIMMIWNNKTLDNKSTNSISKEYFSNAIVSSKNPIQIDNNFNLIDSNNEFNNYNNQNSVHNSNKDDDQFEEDVIIDDEGISNSNYSYNISIKINGKNVFSQSSNSNEIDNSNYSSNSSTHSTSSTPSDSYSSDKSISERITRKSENIYRQNANKERELFEKKKKLLKENDWEKQMISRDIENAIRENNQKQLSYLKEKQKSLNQTFNDNMNQITKDEMLIKDKQKSLEKEIEFYRSKIRNGNLYNWRSIENNQKHYDQRTKSEIEKLNSIERQNRWLDEVRLNDLERVKKDALYKAEVAKKREAQHQLDASRRAESARKAEESKKAEAARYATRQAEALKRVEAAKKAENAKKAEAAKKNTTSKKK